MSLKTTMNELVEFVENLFDSGATKDHYTACCMTADNFQLWQTDEEYLAEPLDAHGDRFPLWLSFVVQGIMREKGIES